jgi:hypothetical protein
MDKYTKEELLEAVRAITSMINKSEKALQKLKEGTWQHKMTVQSIKASYIAITLLNRELGEDEAEGSKSTYTQEELACAIETLKAIIEKVEKISPKFEEGTPQYTLAKRRINALNLSAALIQKEMNTTV